MSGLTGFIFIVIGSAAVAAHPGGLGLSVASIVWIIIGIIVTILLLPWLYKRSLRKRQGSQNLRQYLMQDEKLRESLREHYEKRKTPGEPPKKTQV